MNVKYFILILVSINLSGKEFWSNWAGSQFCNPSEILCPRTVEELYTYIKTATKSNHKIRIVGSGYSYSDLVCTDGLMINLKYFNKILSVDRDKRQVKVESGITIKELNEQLALYNLALSNQAATENITLGGAISTGVHGTGHTGTISSFVIEIELITANGNLLTLSSNKTPLIFNAALVSLGALGIIYSVTLQCESLFFLEEHEEIVDISYLLENYKDLYKQNNFFQFVWDIKTNIALIKYWNRCDPQTANLLSKPKKSYEALAWYLVNDADKSLTSEIAVPIDQLPQALQQTKKIIDTYLQNKTEIFEEVVVRFVKADKNLSLSPAAYEDFAYINVSVPIGDNGINFCKDFEDNLLNYNGRPHWGKINFLNYEKTRKLYGDNLINFINVRNQLDPEKIFSNSFIDRICESK